MRIQKVYPGSLFNTFSIPTLRGGVVKESVVGIGFVLKKAVVEFQNTTHIMYIDACFCSDGWNILLACFIDGNHHIQPLGFRLCHSESYANWYFFLREIWFCGVDRIGDLVVYSDENRAIKSAVRKAFPGCEHCFCFVHLERNIQKKWCTEYGKIDETETESIEALNEFVKCLNGACIATTRRECKEWIERMKCCESQFREEDDGETPVSDYVKRRWWLFMHTWRFNHLMVRTTNPIESCMSSLCRRMCGLGCAREANLFNRYRILVTWMILRMKRRRDVLSGGKAVVPVVEGGKTYGTWIVRQVIMRAHHVQCYKGWFLVRLVSGGEMDVGDWNERVFKVRDCAHDREYTVNLSDRTDPCSCHRGRWEKTPCVHVILLLDYMKQWWRVWEYVGDEYTLQEIEKSCECVGEDEEELIEWIQTWKQEERETGREIHVERSHGNGQKRARFRSTGE